MPSSARVAAIDIGTNSVLLLVAETRGDGAVAVLERARITRLGAGVDRTRRLARDACERTLSCLGEYAELVRQHGVTKLDVVGTSAMRDAENGEEFITRAESLLGVRPRVIAGGEEATLTFAGALSGLAVDGPVTVFDIGGGSTELIVGELSGTRIIDAAVSLDIGSVRLFERHITSDPPTASELERAREDIATALGNAPRSRPSARLVGVAGTVTQLAALELGLESYDGERVHGFRLARTATAELYERLARLDLNTRRALRGMEPARADVIVIGALITLSVLDFYGAGELLVSDRGVRWGLVQELSVSIG